MTSTQAKIQEAASRNAELLQGLQETDSAPSQLYQQINYIKDLDDQITKTEKHVALLKKKTASELADHRKYNESTFRRMAHIASGRKERFAEKAAKEEREYFEAIQEQKTAEDSLAFARQLRAEADLTKQQFEIQASKHDELQNALNALYNSIFTGYTPGFPDEDEKERACITANEYSQSLHQTLEKERQIAYLLKQILSKLVEAQIFLQKAHSASRLDMMSGSGSVSSMVAAREKRNSLERAESSISQIRMLQSQIHTLDPESRVFNALGTMNIASGSIWSDVVFDNLFSDMEMHQKIKESELRVASAKSKCEGLIYETEQQQKRITGSLREAEEELNRARMELQRSREEAFQRIANGEQVQGAAEAVEFRSQQDVEREHEREAPPAYSA